MIPSLYLFVPDFEQVVTPLLDIMYDNTGIVSLHWYYGFDMPCDDDTQMAVQEQIDEYMDEVEATEEPVCPLPRAGRGSSFGKSGVLRYVRRSVFPGGNAGPGLYAGRSAHHLLQADIRGI